MTPKEKAEELVNKYKPFVYCYLGSGMLSNWEDETVILSNAKQCALIAVDEMLKETNTVIPEEVYTDNGLEVIIVLNPRIKYWQEVKNEIEKL